MTDLALLPIDALNLPEEARPRMPPIAGATSGDRHIGTQLAAIHRHYLTELARVDAVLRRIEAGDAPPENLRQIILSTDMAQNLTAVGTLCGQQCHVLTMHHNIEEYHMFPELAGQNNDALKEIVAQLKREHEIVHELLVRLERAADALIASPDDHHFAELRLLFDQLYKAVRSHFGYEEKELAEAIGFYLGGI